MLATDRDKHLFNLYIFRTVPQKSISSNLTNMLVYNQKYQLLLSASLAGVMIEYIGQQTRPSLHGSTPWNLTNFFYLWLRHMEGTLNQL